jgi:hypothetical protein
VSRKPNTERKEKPSGPCIASEARRAVHHCDALRCMTVQRSTTIPACMNVVTLLFLTSDVSNSVEQSPSSGTNGFWLVKKYPFFMESEGSLAMFTRIRR